MSIFDKDLIEKSTIREGLMNYVIDLVKLAIEQCKNNLVCGQYDDLSNCVNYFIQNHIDKAVFEKCQISDIATACVPIANINQTFWGTKVIVNIMIINEGDDRWMPFLSISFRYRVTYGASTSYDDSLTHGYSNASSVEITYVDI